MATSQDVAASRDRASAEARVRQVYANRGAAVPPNLSALVDNYQSNPNYLDTVRRHAARDAAAQQQAAPSNPDGTSGLPVPAQTNLAGHAAALYPWLTPALVDLYAGKWAETGRAEIALAYVRQTSEYARVFPGIRRDDGSLRMSEGEYFSTKAGFTETAAEFGIGGGLNFTKLFEQDVSAQEFYRAAESGYNRFVEPGQPPSGLFQTYIQSVVDTGSAALALEQTRGSSGYDQTFVGNRRSDGSLVMDEPDYFAYSRGWDRLFLNRNLNPTAFRATGNFEKAVRGEVSIAELDGRLNAVESGIVNNTEGTRQFFTENYGITDLSTLGQDNRNLALAMAIDTSVGSDVLARNISASQIGGEAALQGYRRSVERAETLARAGVSQSQARGLYSQAGTQLPGLSATTERFNRGATDLTAFEDAFALGDASETARLQRALGEEQSSFSGRADTRVDRSGGLSGLRQR